MGWPWKARSTVDAVGEWIQAAPYQAWALLPMMARVSRGAVVTGFQRMMPEEGHQPWVRGPS